MIKRIALFAVFLIAIAGIFAGIRKPPETIRILDAQAVAAERASDMFMVSLTIENEGTADALLGVKSNAVPHIMVMNAENKPLVVPGNGVGQLAMDGAHIMMKASDFDVGGFVPVTLSFAQAGDVVARVENTGTSPMQHGQMGGVAIDPSPQLRIVEMDEIGAEGGEVTLVAENFTFVRTEVGAPHVPGEGHAHVYLNGLKLGRLYEEKVTLGGLMPGDYVLRISLNTHDHQAYLDDGVPVAAEVTFTVPG